MIVDVSDDMDPATWAPLPVDDRVLVGGHTVWTGPFRSPLLVAQPNRWGVIERAFPDLPCLVEADPSVTGHLPLPDEVVGFVDRTHRSIDRPRPDPAGRRLMETAARLAKSLQQIKGVEVAAMPFARTVPLLVPRDPIRLADECVDDGLVGLRPLPELGGGVALSVHEDHDAGRLQHIVTVLRERTGG